MKTKRIGTGHYKLTGTTSLDGKTVSISVSVWKNEGDGWLSDALVDGRSVGSFNCHESKRDAVAAAECCIASGYQTVPGLGLCLA